MEGRSLWKLLLPLGLIFLGLALLCSNLGIAPGLWNFIIGLWPLLLIGLGLAVLLGWRGNWGWIGYSGRSVPFNLPLDQVRTASMDLSSRAGTLSLEAASTSSQDLLGGKIPEGSRTDVDSAGQSARIRFHHRSPASWWPFGGSAGEWDLRLHPDVTWTLKVGGGVGETELDLTDLRVTDLQVEGHVGEVKIRLPRQGQTTVAVGGRLGDLTLRIPDGMAARIHRPGGSLGSTRINTTRFPQNGDVYESPGFESAVDWVEIRLDSSLGDLRIT